MSSGNSAVCLETLQPPASMLKCGGGSRPAGLKGNNSPALVFQLNNLVSVLSEKSLKNNIHTHPGLGYLVYRNESITACPYPCTVQPQIQ